MAIKEVLHTDLAPAAVGPYSQAIAANGHEEPAVRSGTGRRVL